jgi:FKBP-type peptidyl-prolyl cis-trans isomerase SlyD
MEGGTQEIAMQITKNKVVLIDFTLTGPDGSVIDSSRGRSPMAYLHGTNSIIPGLEKALEGKTAGEQLIVDVKPEDAYGKHEEQMVQSVPRDRFKGVTDMKPGMQFQANTPSGPRVVTVVSFDESSVRIDANHPLAGVPLKFEVAIVEVREPTPDELAHGHVHGPGGHEH